MSVPKGHHVLPNKAHLDGFTTDGRLWVFDRINKQFLNPTPRSATVRNHYYSFVDALGNKDTTVENPVLSGIEGATIPIIRKLEDRHPLTLDDRHVLSLFVACMFFRTPAFQRIHDRIGDELHRFRNRFIFSSPEKLQKMLDALPEHVKSVDLASAKELCDFVQQGDYNVKFHRNASLEMMLGLMIEFTPIFASLDWVIGHADSEEVFLTTDAPFVISPPPDFPSHLGSGRGILVRGATKAIPLSQRLCLTMGDPGGMFGHVDLSADQVNTINLGFASRAERLIISPEESLLKSVVARLGWDKHT